MRFIKYSFSLILIAFLTTSCNTNISQFENHSDFDLKIVEPCVLTKEKAIEIAKIEWLKIYNSPTTIAEATEYSVELDKSGRIWKVIALPNIKMPTKKGEFILVHGGDFSAIISAKDCCVLSTSAGK